jgi:hypothetical protein
MRARERRFCQEPRLCSFPFPFSLKGVQGDFLFSPSLFFDFADGDPPPVDNLSVIIGFFLSWFVVCVRLAITRPREIVICRVGQPANKKRPSGTKPEGLKKA